jgi:spore coat polysaccharide biosynthesis protein SpsF (cytidylyltransferase family)
LEANKPIIKFAKKNKIDFFIGDEDEVLDRYYQTAKSFK